MENVKGTVVLVRSSDQWTEWITDMGYTPIKNCAEVKMCAHRYADLISSMTIHLMENQDNGDVRVRDGLARKLDIDPNPLMTRKTMVYQIVETMLLGGDGNQITIPTYDQTTGLLESLNPIPSSQVSFVDEVGGGYQVQVNGKRYRSDEVLHFVLNSNPEKPYLGKGFSTELMKTVETLLQAGETKAALMKHPVPSMVMKVDATSGELDSPEGRRKIVDEYMSETDRGRPLALPAEMISIDQIKPLTINDLAIPRSVELDKRTIAGVFGIPPFMVGVGNFNADEYNNFISSSIMPVAKAIEQELTRKLLISPNRYIRFNSRSIYSYSMEQMASIATQMVDRGLLTGNEAREMLNFPPRADMDEPKILENYIPVSQIGMQNKLTGGGDASE